MILNHDDILQLDKRYRTTLINNVSGIRSANLIATRSGEGLTNLAIFNSVSHVGANPPLLGLLMRPTEEVARHTYENILETGVFTINSVGEDSHQGAHQSSAKYSRNESEFQSCGLQEVYHDGFEAPFVGESEIKIGLSFEEEHLIESNKTRFIVGRIQLMIISDDIVEQDGYINHETAKSVGIGGLDSYYSCSRIGRYGFARPK